MQGDARRWMPSRLLNSSNRRTIVATTRGSSPSEHWEQRKFVSWFRKTYPGVIIFAIPNGGKRNAATAARLRLEGVTPGVWDLFVPAWGMWIEFKLADRGTLSGSQCEFGKAMLALGYDCMAAWGCDDAIQQLQEGVRPEWKRPKDVDKRQTRD